MKLGLMVCGERPDVRVGRITEALSEHGWEHDTLCAQAPAQFAHVYRNVDWNPYRTYREFVKAIAEHPASIIHVHGELYSYWALHAAKEGAHGRPVVFNVHDLPSAREGSIYDVFEKSAIEAADALVWVTPDMQKWANRVGIKTNQPSCVIPNYPSRSVFIDGTPMSHIGGVVYEGGADKRGQAGAWRDLSPIADALDGKLHIYPGQSGVNYGRVHQPEYSFPLLMHRLARHAWGFVGIHPANEAWTQSIPTKAFDYIAAGVPLICMNVPLLTPLCKAGMGRVARSLEDVAKIAAMDPAPYREAVLAKRDEYALQRHIEPLVDLYRGLTCT